MPVKRDQLSKDVRSTIRLRYNVIRTTSGKIYGSNAVFGEGFMYFAMIQKEGKKYLTEIRRLNKKSLLDDCLHRGYAPNLRAAKANARRWFIKQGFSLKLEVRNVL